MAPPAALGPQITSATGQRTFACFPAAVLAFIVDDSERLLLMNLHDRYPGWQVISGALEAGETVTEGVLREVREEAGPDVQVRPLGVLHTHTFEFDERVRYMLSICCLLEYRGGTVVAGDDAAGAEFRWWTLDALEADEVDVSVPRDAKWLLRRAIEAFRLWRDQPSHLLP